MINLPDNVNLNDKLAPWNWRDDVWDGREVDECADCGDKLEVDENYLCENCYNKRMETKDE